MTTKNDPPNVIFIGGPMGSGKTTVGKILADLIKYNFVEGDDFHSEEMKQKMSAGIPLNDEDRQPWLISLAALWQNNPEKKMVITCSALNKAYREILLGSKESRENNVKIVLLRVNEETLRERLIYRAKHPPYHFASPNLLPSQLQDFEVPKGFAWVYEPTVYVFENNNESFKTATNIQNLFFGSAETTYLQGIYF